MYKYYMYKYYSNYHIRNILRLNPNNSEYLKDELNKRKSFIGNEGWDKGYYFNNGKWNKINRKKVSWLKEKYKDLDTTILDKYFII